MGSADTMYDLNDDITELKVSWWQKKEFLEIST